MERNELRALVEARIAYWENELRELPYEYTDSNWQRLDYIREVLTGLGDIYNRFCRAPEPKSAELGVLY